MKQNLRATTTALMLRCSCEGFSPQVTELTMISLTRREFDAVSSKLLEACLEARAHDRPVTADMRQRLKATASSEPPLRSNGRVTPPVH